MNWFVIGNGPLERFPSGPGIRTIVFNRGFEGRSPTCRLINARLSEGGNRIDISGEAPFSGFERQVNQTRISLQRCLNAIPSTGLSCVYTMLQSGCIPDVVGMNLLPGLIRDRSLSYRKPMACYFHNWLAERRLVLSHLENLQWSQFYLKPLEGSGETKENPYKLLRFLRDEKKTEQSNILQILSEVKQECWLAFHESSFEFHDSLFHLSRDQSISPNWWLFNYKASALVSRIHHQLAWAEQESFFQFRKAENVG